MQKAALTIAFALVVSVLSPSASSAVSIFVPNHSFEVDTLGAGSASAGIPTSWSRVGGGGTFHPSGGNFVAETPLAAPADGNQYAYFETGTTNPGTVTLTNAASLGTTSVGMTYVLTAALGHRNFDGAGGRRPDDYLIELLVDGIPVASNTLSNAHTNIPSGTWVDLQTSFVAASAGSLTVRLTHSSDDATFRQGAIDNIRVDQIPEPSAFALFGLAGLGLVLRRRR